PQKSLAPQTHVDTLNSSPAVHQPSTAPPPFQTAATKRSKIHDARGPDEDIVEGEHDIGSRQERYGSQSSYAAHSTSPGVAEFQSVEASMCRSGRPNRRGRKQHGDHPSPMNHHGRTFRAPMESIDSFDELAPAKKPPVSRQRTARLVSINDAADAYILGARSRLGKHQHSLKKSKNRSSYDITSDHDELGDESSDEGDAATGASSVSRRGDIKPTKWASTPRTATMAINVCVEAAVCQPNLRFVADKGQSPCFLRPTDGPELRAFMKSGNTAEPYPWLKITGKARTLTYHPDSNLIKISQPNDHTLAVSIGSLMILRLVSSAEAVQIAEWARDNSRIDVVQEEDSLKLLLTWDKTSQEVGLASSHASATRQPESPPAARPRRTTKEVPTADAPPTGSPPASSRTPLRSQMRVSAHHKTPLPATSAAGGLAVSSSRSLRSRVVPPRVQKPEKPQSPRLPRWSDENPDWAKNWEIPLVFERNTVDKDDIPRLDEGECLNDNLVGYGLRYLFRMYGADSGDLAKRVFIHNSFFYEKLKGSGGAAINYDGVKSWTSRVDLLSYDYIVVPVNEYFHWWVAIICNPAKLDPDAKAAAASAKLNDLAGEPEEKGDGFDVKMTDSLDPQIQASALPSDEKEPATTVYNLVQSDIVVVSDDKNDSIDLTSAFRTKKNRKQKAGGARAFDPDAPRIITLDSMGASHPVAVSHLKKYLLAEFAHKRNKVLPDYPLALGMKAANIPQQDNVCDCGVYLLGYVQEFLREPDQFIRTLLKRETPDWDFSPSDLRERWRDTILCKQKSYQSAQLAAKKKLAASSAKPTPKPSVEPSREGSEAISTVNSNQGTTVNSAEESPSAKVAGTPARSEIREPNGHTDHRPQANGTESLHSSPSASANSPQQSPLQKSPKQGAPSLPTQQTTNGDAVIPSIEPPEVEELPQRSGRHNPPPNDEPQFLGPLASSSSSSPSSAAIEPYAIDDDDDDDVVSEIPPRSFYSAAAARATPRKRRSPAALSTEERRQKMARTRPPPPPTTASHFVVDSPEREGVVERAEMVRDDGGTIDLTEG
ncbi:hypothetical protein C8A05DRAFT_16022, partial [Staphylotrichum tortipilum]